MDQKDTAHAYAKLGLTYLEQERLDDARAMLTRAVGLDPGRAPYWEILAILFGRLELFDEALPCWKKTFALMATAKASSHVGYGLTLQNLNRQEEAEQQFRAAVALAPHSAPILTDLGTVLLENGRLEEAESVLREAIRQEPNYPGARIQLTTLLRGKISDEDQAALTAQLDHPATSANWCTKILFALGQSKDARAEYGEAATLLRQANTLREALRTGPERFVPTEFEQLVDDLIGVFDADLFARLAGAGLDTPRPVFLVGLPRSGTTLLEQVLASHPRVQGAGELSLGRWTFESLPAVVGASGTPTDSVRLLEPKIVGKLGRSYLRRLHGLTPRLDDAERVIDKMPENYLYLGLLSILFPNATIVHCRRDLRDVALSCWMNNFDQTAWTNDPGQIATVFRGYLRLIEHWKAVLLTPLIEVDYEETVTNLEGVARRVLSAMGLDWNPICLEFHRNRRTIRTASVAQVRQPVYTRSVARWTHYETVLADLFESLPIRTESLHAMPLSRAS